MGSAQSSDRPDLPLQAQDTPVYVSSHSLVSTSQTSLRVKVGSWGSTKVFDSHSSTLLYEIRTGMLSSRVTLQNPNGTAVMSFKKKMLQKYYRVFDGDKPDEETIGIVAKSPMFSPLVVFTEFENPVNGRLCRVLVEGGCDETVSTIYVERGSPELSPLESRDIANTEQYERIGRILRYKAGKEEYIEAAAGVDLTLLVLFWLVRMDISSTSAAQRKGWSAGFDLGAAAGA